MGTGISKPSPVGTSELQSCPNYRNGHFDNLSGRLLWEDSCGRKAPNSIREQASPRFLRLRAITALVCDKCARRFAPTARRGRQDDGFAEGLDAARQALSLHRSTVAKALEGLRPLFRPMYAEANMGHPSRAFGGVRELSRAEAQKKSQALGLTRLRVVVER